MAPRVLEVAAQTWKSRGHLRFHGDHRDGRMFVAGDATFISCGGDRQRRPRGRCSPPAVLPACSPGSATGWRRAAFTRSRPPARESRFWRQVVDRVMREASSGHRRGRRTAGRAFDSRTRHNVVQTGTEDLPEIRPRFRPTSAAGRRSRLRPTPLAVVVEANDVTGGAVGAGLDALSSVGLTAASTVLDGAPTSGLEGRHGVERRSRRPATAPTSSRCRPWTRSGTGSSPRRSDLLTRR